jgi:ATP-dependent RNA helicase DDX55/SPB4
VVQFDPPQDPTQFNHRAGRTARAGQKGKAVVLLTQEGREEDYVEFMKRRGVPLIDELENSSSGFRAVTEQEGEKVNASLRKIVMKDRDLHDKGIKAFVSSVRSYTKHEASYIFSIKHADLLGAASAFGLLKLPKMPELKEAKGKEDWKAGELDWDKYAYLDKDKESARLQELARLKEEGEKAFIASKTKLGPKQTQSWSRQIEAREKRELNKEKKTRKKAYLREQKAAFDESKAADNNASGSTKHGKKSQADQDDEDDEDDAEELAEDTRAAKRLKKGRSEQQTGLDMAFTDL